MAFLLAAACYSQLQGVGASFECYAEQHHHRKEVAAVHLLATDADAPHMKGFVLFLTMLTIVDLTLVGP